MSPDDADIWFHNFTSFVYFTPVVGALIADVFWGKYNTILWVSLLYCAGHGVLAMGETRTHLFIGLTLIGMGAGGIKPCVSAHVGDQFGPANEHLLSKVYNWFYFSINLGAFLAQFVHPVAAGDLRPAGRVRRAGRPDGDRGLRLLARPVPLRPSPRAGVGRGPRELHRPEPAASSCAWSSSSCSSRRSTPSGTRASGAWVNQASTST